MSSSNPKPVSKAQRFTDASRKRGRAQPSAANWSSDSQIRLKEVAETLESLRVDGLAELTDDGRYVLTPAGRASRRAKNKSVSANLDGAGIYGAFGRSLFEGYPPCGNVAEITKLRPVVQGMTTKDTLKPSDIERTWLLPLGVNPGPVPPDILGELVATLERGKAVVLCGSHEEAVEVASDLLSDWIGGGQV